jgi:hypothetical protein
MSMELHDPRGKGEPGVETIFVDLEDADKAKVIVMMPSVTILKYVSLLGLHN